MSGQLYVLSGPSGVGKSTIIQRLRKRLMGLGYSISHTSRKPRPNEVNGVDYHFVERETFRKMIDGGAFVEWAEVHGDLKGTDRRLFEECLSCSRACILDVDVQGAISIMKVFPNALTLFIAPPSIEELRVRLEKRGTESAEELKIRLSNAEKELEYRDLFQYIVVNDSVDRAVNEIERIIDAELENRRR